MGSKSQKVPWVNLCTALLHIPCTSWTSLFNWSIDITCFPLSYPYFHSVCSPVLLFSFSFQNAIDFENRCVIELYVRGGNKLGLGEVHKWKHCGLCGESNGHVWKLCICICCTDKWSLLHWSHLHPLVCHKHKTTLCISIISLIFENHDNLVWALKVSKCV